MNSKRRTLLKAGGGISLYWLTGGLANLLPVSAMAAEKPEFEARSLDDLVKALGGSGAQESADILFKAPDIAENGAVVPVEVESKLAGTQAIAIAVEKNPHALAANFAIPEGTDPFISTRVKVAETSNVYALVKTDKGFFYAQKQVKVTLGGCGG